MYLLNKASLIRETLEILNKRSTIKKILEEYEVVSVPSLVTNLKSLRLEPVNEAAKQLLENEVTYSNGITYFQGKTTETFIWKIDLSTIELTIDLTKVNNTSLTEFHQFLVTNVILLEILRKDINFRPLLTDITVDIKFELDEERFLVEKFIAEKGQIYFILHLLIVILPFFMLIPTSNIWISISVWGLAAAIIATVASQAEINQPRDIRLAHAVYNKYYKKQEGK
jgi:hypothetical protein